MPPCNILSSLDLRFKDHKVESSYYNYYAQVKRNLLPTAIQVVLSVNILQLFATIIHIYLLTTRSISIKHNINSNNSNNNTNSDINATTNLQDNSPTLFSDSNNATNISSSSKLPIIPLILQLIILIATFTLLKVVKAELNPRKSVDKFNRRRFSSTGRSSAGGGAAGIEIATRSDSNSSLASSNSTYSRNNVDEEEDSDDSGAEDAALKSSERDIKKRSANNKTFDDCNESNHGGFSNSNSNNNGGKSKSDLDSSVKTGKNHKRSESGRRRRSSFSPTKLSKCKLLLPYLLWLCQLIQLTSGLWPQQSFISYSMLLLYSYTIYVIFPIRLMSCIMLALGMSLSQPILDHLLLINLQELLSSNKSTSIDIISSTPATSTSEFSENSNSSPFLTTFNNSTSSSRINYYDDNSILIPMTSHLSKLWAFMLLAIGVNVIGIMSFFFYERQQRAAFLETRQSLETKLILEQESQEQERLLLSILPKHLASEIRQDLGAVVGGQFKKIYMSRHENVSILFADIVGFTAISSHCPAAELVQILNELFARFDKLAEKYHQLRIKILGDCYYAISGAPKERPDHAVLCVHMGLSMVEAIKSVRQKTKSTVDMRVGIHTGGVLAGVLGQRQWQFDVYSKAVELANKMESSGSPGRVHISNATLRFLNDEFEVVDGFGDEREEALRLAGLKTYFIERVKKAYPQGTLDANKEHRTSDDSRVVSSATQVVTIKGTTTTTTTSSSSDSNKKAIVTPKSHNLSSSQSRGDVGQNSKDRNDSFNLDNQIKQFSLNFTNRHFEKQFRCTADIASCISLIGLPITLLCSFLAHLYLYRVQTEVTIVYVSNFVILLLVVLVCILPYSWIKPANTQSNQHQCLTKSIISIADAVKQNAWMKLALTAFMTLVWLAAHMIAAQQTSSQLIYITNLQAIRLFTVDLFNYFAIACSLAITAVTRISFLVKTIIILIVIIIQVIMNLTILSKLLGNRLTQQTIVPTDMTSSQMSNILETLPYDNDSSIINDYNFDQYIFTLTLITIFWALFLINRQFELTNRRLFLWRKQVEQRKEKVADIREKNEALVYNILPPNVAKIFLGKRILNDEELYSKSYEAVGVLFAAMPNFSDFYSEDAVNNQGLECLRFLNEVISDYDALLDKARFKNIIKIKTMGSTYMAASGLYEEDQANKWGHLENLTEFALALKDTLNNINKESFNNFVLRIGINQGPITAGVIGVKKPHFDMWGNTVNVASRMESTGRAGSIQVVQETAEILGQFGFIFEQRGMVYVKGKGELMTFYLTGRNLQSKQQEQQQQQRPPSLPHSPSKSSQS